MPHELANVKILLGISGGIAAYKTPNLVRQLRRAGAEVNIILTEAASHLVSKTALEVVSENLVATTLWPKIHYQFTNRENQSSVPHISLARDCDLVLVAPATANIIAKCAAGIADDLLSTTLLATDKPIMFVPAMNTVMLNHPATIRNINTLESWGCIFIESSEGDLACGETGKGRMVDEEIIVQSIIEFHQQHTESKILSGKKILITAGGTKEPIDPVRIITNNSTGTLACRVAEKLSKNGALVTFVHTGIPQPNCQLAHSIRVNTAIEMQAALQEEINDADVLIMLAAVADFRATYNEHKIKKADKTSEFVIHLTTNPDILKELGSNKRKDQIFIGVAAETDHPIENAKLKLKHKNLDLILVTDINAGGYGDSRITGALIDNNDKIIEYQASSKQQVANDFLQFICNQLK